MSVSGGPILTSGDLVGHEALCLGNGRRPTGLAYTPCFVLAPWSLAYLSLPICFHHLSSSPPPQLRNADHSKGRMLIEKLGDWLESQQKNPPIILGKGHKRDKVNLS
jgi:hypothetical protein